MQKHFCAHLVGFRRRQLCLLQLLNDSLRCLFGFLSRQGSILRRLDGLLWQRFGFLLDERVLRHWYLNRRCLAEGLTLESFWSQFFDGLFVYLLCADNVGVF